jgi:hypothetical protein
MRKLRHDERAVIEALLSDLPEERSLCQYLLEAVVEDMSDGGMGSVRFVWLSGHDSRFGRQLREATFADADGLPASVTLNLDQAGRLFELDIFKADSSPLKRFPNPEDLEIR